MITFSPYPVSSSVSHGSGRCLQGRARLAVSELEPHPRSLGHGCIQGAGYWSVGISPGQTRSAVCNGPSAMAVTWGQEYWWITILPGWTWSAPSDGASAIAVSRGLRVLVGWSVGQLVGSGRPGDNQGRVWPRMLDNSVSFGTVMFVNFQSCLVDLVLPELRPVRVMWRLVPLLLPNTGHSVTHRSGFGCIQCIQ